LVLLDQSFLQFSILSTHPPEPYKSLPISKCLVLDPWLDPFSSPGPGPIKRSNKGNDVNGAVEDVDAGAPHDETDKFPRMLIINSEGFTLWTDHFTRCDVAAKTFGAKLFTLG
jgi:platelet-activating factor acetylhydrolase